MTWFFTSDEHYGHEKIINYCHRPFGSVEEMNETLIANHNSVATKHDTTVHLGDFGWFKKKDQADKVIHRLNGNHIFLKGSHDRWLPDSHRTQWRRHINGRFIVCCHYAFRTWERSRYGAINLYGHSHGTLPGIGRQMDVGVDCNNFYPFSLDEILERMSGVGMLREDDHATQALSRAELICRQKDVVQYNLNAEEQRVYDEQFDEALHPNPERPE